MLFITMQESRLEHLREELKDLPQDLGGYYRLTTFERAIGDFFSAIWHSRVLSDTALYPLVREG